MTKRRTSRARLKMFSFARARGALARWLAQVGGNSRKARNFNNGAPLPARYSADINRRLLSLLGSAAAQPNDWLGRVRLINLGPIKQRVGYAWPKLSEKIELLAAKIICDELSPRDAYVRMAEAEFLVFFADSGPEEAKIRCLAIVEMIHEKLFGREAPRPGTERMAECYVLDRERLGLESTAKTAAADTHLGGQAPLDSLRHLFRADAEVLNGADVAASIQAVLDIIIRRASDSLQLAELDPLAIRLKHLARNFAVLKPAVIAKERDSNRNRNSVQAMSDAEKDTGELMSVIESDSGQSHGKIMEALATLRSARAERAAKALGRTPLPCRSDAAKMKMMELEYLPVHRLVSQGEQIYRGFYRVSFRDVPQLMTDLPAVGSDDLGNADSRYRAAAACERLLLEQAIKYCSDRLAADFVLIAPVHVGTLRRPYFLRRYSTILRAVQFSVKRRLIVEITGYRESDDTISMRRAIEEIHVHAHAVFITQSHGDVVNVRLAVEGCKRLGANVIGLDFSNCDEPEAKVVSALSQFAQLGQEFGIPTCIGGIKTPAVLAKAIARNVSYICAPHLVPTTAIPDNFGRTTLDSVFWAVP